MINDIKDFHEKFALTYAGSPRELAQDLSNFRIAFMQEELNEYVEATNLEGKLDALVDLVYVALGTAYLHGFDFITAWNRVHAANMAKVRGASERSEYDIIKPEGWLPPDLSDLVQPLAEPAVEQVHKPSLRGQ